MNRAVQEISQKVYDIAIIGGGIYGASVARDAALRGLSVALVDKGDFGSGTSANSHKIIHGGLRYLQHGDVKRMRESIRERSTLMKIAPHLVSPMPFLIPTYKKVMQGRMLMRVVLKLNDLIGFDRNHHLTKGQRLPNGRLISRAECIELCPHLEDDKLSGGALFYDAQVHNADRLTFSVLLSASEAGADLANYVQVRGVLREQNVIKGFQATDVLTNNPCNVRANMVVNATGPWLNSILNMHSSLDHSLNFRFLKAIVLVTRSLVKGVAVGIPGRSSYVDRDALVKKGRRYFFITPWRHKSLIGTFQNPYVGAPDEISIDEEDIQELMEEINHGLPGCHLRREDVHFLYAGLLPSDEGVSDTGLAQLIKHYHIYDHAENDGLQGLLSVIGVKYTTARDVAEKVVDLALQKLKKKHVICQTAHKSVYGGDVGEVKEIIRLAFKDKPTEMSFETIEHLVRTYGSGWQEILQWTEDNPDWSKLVCQSEAVIRAEVLHAVRKEMAQKLGDVIFRRTELGTGGFPGVHCLRTSAAIMAQELGWSSQRTEQEVTEVEQAFLQTRDFAFGQA